MSRDDSARIKYMLRAIAKCRNYFSLIQSDSSADFVELVEDAIERNLQIIGEAANHLSSEFTIIHSDIAWPQIRGLRNILVHEYFGVDTDTIRDVIENYLPELQQSLSNHISD
ncbi:MAG: HepT-like ribonuclease domain-containing protein [Mobiluncus porci]|uniref:HepT-like ribonuclease domain-containing protein n=1 Tax=Mobiluncus porci TaxID=2652278 RepID=UPI0023F11BEB|nr:HepT-like ribonuclease domain-containing protein [Mobiluncus porci]MDD7542572.1 DUF86 domain-containing protein [Mobiluncus porci]MDY5749160.1 HepT-like ribonuclease domain-containing protein [Mobiluncus porci]